MANDFSQNNIRVHLSQLPPGWAEQLKAFFIKQPDFNESVATAFATQLKANAQLQQKLQQIEQRIRKLEGK